MTNEQVMKIMEELGLHEGGIENWIPDNGWVKVAEKVAAAEREACAKLCDAECNPAPNEGHVSSYQAGCYITAEYLAADIRRRGQG